MNLEAKEQAISNMSNRFAEASSTFLVDYNGCSCQELEELRSKLRTSDAAFSVVKNTLAKRAISDSCASGLEEFFVGPTAVIWSQSDPVSPAKVLTEFADDIESFTIKAGVVDGEVVDVTAIESLAKMPSKEQLQSKLLALINAPAVRLLQTMNAPGTNLVRLLGAWKGELEKKGEEG